MWVSDICRMKNLASAYFFVYMNFMSFCYLKTSVVKKKHNKSYSTLNIVYIFERLLQINTFITDLIVNYNCNKMNQQKVQYFKFTLF